MIVRSGAPGTNLAHVTGRRTGLMWKIWAATLIGTPFALGSYAWDPSQADHQQ